MVKTYGDLYLNARREIAKFEPEQASFVARELMAAATGKTVEQLLRDRDAAAPPQMELHLNKLILDYVQDKPLPYILGSWSFFGLDLKVTPDVLIPRDDTLPVTQLAMEKLPKGGKMRVLDLCTGSGCIGIAIGARCPHARVTLADISDAALAIAKENVTTHRLQFRTNIVKLDAMQPCPDFLGKYDVIVSNPPYITVEEMKGLDRSVREYEPHLALCGGEDGLDFYRAICENFSDALTDGGWLCFEFGKGQEDAVGAILSEYHYSDLQFSKDTSEITRAVAARKTERN